MKRIILEIYEPAVDYGYEFNFETCPYFCRLTVEMYYRGQTVQLSKDGVIRLMEQGNKVWDLNSFQESSDCEFGVYPNPAPVEFNELQLYQDFEEWYDLLLSDAQRSGQCTVLVEYPNGVPPGLKLVLERKAA